MGDELFWEFLEEDEFREECGIAAVILKNPNDKTKGGAAYYTYRMLVQLQNRGQLSAGIASYSVDRPERIVSHKRMGLVKEVMKDNNPKKHFSLLKRINGTSAIGHVRYATSGSRGSSWRNLINETQPFHRKHGREWKDFALAFNGNLTNYHQLRTVLEEENEYTLHTSVDTEIIMHFTAIELSRAAEINGNQKPKLEDVITRATRNFDGAYNIVQLNSQGEIAAYRDPKGFKPLCWGQNENLIAISSESIALDNLNIQRQDMEDIEPGEILVVDDGKIRKSRYTEKQTHSHCMFEWVYFARAGSEMHGVVVDHVRRNLGVELAKSEEIIADDTYVVCPIPQTSRPMAESYAHSLGLQVISGIEKNPGRTFIDPSEIRNNQIDDKYTFIRDSFKGKKVILVDDSIVRGTTIEQIIGKVKEKCGATEVHVRSACPKIIAPCFYGIDFPTVEELIASKYSDDDEIARNVGAKTLRYQTIDGLLDALGPLKNEVCYACLNKKYPTKGGLEQYKKLVS